MMVGFQNDRKNDWYGHYLNLHLDQAFLLCDLCGSTESMGCDYGLVSAQLSALHMVKYSMEWYLYHLQKYHLH